MNGVNGTSNGVAVNGVASNGVPANGVASNGVASNGHTGNGVTNGVIKPLPESMLNGAAGVQTKFGKLASGLEKVGADPRIAGSFSGHHSTDSLSKLYDAFATDYESAYADVEYEGPMNVAKVLRAIVPAEESAATLILDAGCGSGLVGQACREQGFSRIVGADYSEGMLELARKKGTLYERLLRVDLTQPLPFKDNEFDAVVSCGVFTAGHVDKEALIEVVRCVRPGGNICIGCQEHVYISQGFPAFLDKLEAAGKLKQMGRTTAYAMRKTKTEMTIVHLKVC